MTPSIETRTSWIVASLSLVILGVSFGAAWIGVVALKPIAAETGGARSVPALAIALAWFGTGIGGIAMGYVADRIGVRWTVMFGATMMGLGLAISSYGQDVLGTAWALYIGHGLFMGLLGNSGLNAPLYVYVSRWFDRRRGSALALIASGQYISGAIWPAIFEGAIASYGWRNTMLVFGIFLVLTVVPIALIALRIRPKWRCLPSPRRQALRGRPCSAGRPISSSPSWRSHRSAAASRWRCRSRILWRSAATSASNRPMAQRCSPCCSGSHSSRARCGDGSRTASADCSPC